MMPELGLPTGLSQHTLDAAATTMRRTGVRIKAPATDIDLVLAVLFAEAIS